MNQYNKDKTGQTRLSYWMTWLMCVLCALVLWVYVMNEQNPITTKIFRVPLKAENLAEDMVVKDMPETVNVKISGTRSQIAALREGDIQAYVDFSDAPKGQNGYNVQARTRMGEVAEISPSVLQLETDALTEKAFTVEPRIVGVPNSGITVSQMALSPNQVTVKGASTRIAQVDKVIVMVDISNQDKNFTAEATTVAVDRTGREMYDVKVEPTKVTATVTVVRQLGTNNFPVKANMSGSLPAGTEIESIKITPSTVRLTAEPKVLGGIKEILTAPIVLDNVTSDVQLKMPLQIPDQVLADEHSVLVDITLKKTQEAGNRNAGTSQ